MRGRMRSSWKGWSSSRPPRLTPSGWRLPGPTPGISSRPKFLLELSLDGLRRKRRFTGSWQEWPRAAEGDEEEEEEGEEKEDEKTELLPQISPCTLPCRRFWSRSLRPRLVTSSPSTSWSSSSLSFVAALAPFVEYISPAPSFFFTLRLQRKCMWHLPLIQCNTLHLCVAAHAPTILWQVSIWIGTASLTSCSYRRLVLCSVAVRCASAVWTSCEFRAYAAEHHGIAWCRHETRRCPGCPATASGWFWSSHALWCLSAVWQCCGLRCTGTNHDCDWCWLASRRFRVVLLLPLVSCSAPASAVWRTSGLRGRGTESVWGAHGRWGGRLIRETDVAGHVLQDMVNVWMPRAVDQSIFPHDVPCPGEFFRPVDRHRAGPCHKGGSGWMWA